MSNFCPNCGTEIVEGIFCPECGTRINISEDSNLNNGDSNAEAENEIQGFQLNAIETNATLSSDDDYTKSISTNENFSSPYIRNKTVAGLLAIFLGGLGAHKFYLHKPIWGIIYLLFFLTGISPIVAFIEGIIYLVESPERFEQTQNVICQR